MTLVGIPVQEQDAVWQLVAVVLHLGNLDFREGDVQDSSAISEPAAEHLEAASRLLGTRPDILTKALTTRTRQTPDGEQHSAPMTFNTGTKLCCALALPGCHCWLGTVSFLDSF